MNVGLVPYTWTRHLVSAWWVGGASVVAWWLVSSTLMGLAPWAAATSRLWSRTTEGLVVLGAVAASTAAMSVWQEGTLWNEKRRWRLFFTLSGAGAAAAATGAAYLLHVAIGYLIWVLPGAQPEWFGAQTTAVTTTAWGDGWAFWADESMASLRSRISMWAATGMSAAYGAYFARRLRIRIDELQVAWEQDWMAHPWPVHETPWGDYFLHLGAGLAGGLAAACVWHLAGVNWFYDYYLGFGLASFTLGALVGGLPRGIPDQLFAGWVRVLSRRRFGMRVPIDDPSPAVTERFVGHYPLGLDLHLPMEDGVAEVHCSFRREADGTYAVRGLSMVPTRVRRPGARAELTFPRNHPAPFAMPLEPEDLVVLGEGDQPTILEFVMIPREEA